jgi:DNA-binding HxlR family transcriptional regulator
MEIENKQVCTYANSQAVMLPMSDALEVLRGRWRLPILVSLVFGTKRFTQISKEVAGISDKILAKELKELEINQLIKRTVYNGFPSTVEYSITPHGASVEKVMIELKNWGEKHRREIIGK